MSGEVWGLVLAGGDGARLRALTTQSCGSVAPKQFCSLYGEQTLIEDALDRTVGLVGMDRLCAIVAQQHVRWWSNMERVHQLAPGNLIVQPRNRGTAIGILYSLLHILARDPRAQVLMLPADHYVRDERKLTVALRNALAHVERAPERPVLLGLEPEDADPELGYILCGAPDALGGCAVQRFVEKPPMREVREIIAAGGLWNTFIIASAAQAIVDLFLPRYAALVMEMQVIVARGVASGSPTASWPAMVDMYERLPELDFSRDLLEGKESHLSVVRAPQCGWSDLGTPHRVGETLRRLRPREMHAHNSRSAYLNLAIQHARYTQLAAHGTHSSAGS